MKSRFEMMYGVRIMQLRVHPRISPFPEKKKKSEVGG
jgi:hypothetical protein